MLQKEQPEGLFDAECGKPVAKGHAGLCEYVEGREGGREGGRGAANWPVIWDILVVFAVFIMIFGRLIN